MEDSTSVLYTIFATVKYLFIIIGLIGLVMLAVGIYRKDNESRRRGTYIFLFGAILAVCTFLINRKLNERVDSYIDSYINTRIAE
ncbi:hypothetical protein M2132_001697 [Dysgonomonas sp. PH5-45]|uniref:hypothetical protein n=1 Tax=unclassified Dysgonomonas TaxID=2630389 RepID=UPI002474C853|nr:MULTISPECIES: hypothetical protein [unclassified Dysgonomonas]MDH6355356.1 hypothetical protein [Dysgonomonas sp. PH5-45]MDH6388254.1 hypothetical protein [Dysgonomonas sp. PH5-37]